MIPPMSLLFKWNHSIPPTERFLEHLKILFNIIYVHLWIFYNCKCFEPTILGLPTRWRCSLDCQGTQCTMMRLLISGHAITFIYRRYLLLRYFISPPLTPKTDRKQRPVLFPPIQAGAGHWRSNKFITFPSVCGKSFTTELHFINYQGNILAQFPQAHTSAMDHQPPGCSKETTTAMTTIAMSMIMTRLCLKVSVSCFL